MSERRSISFADNEKDLLAFFDANGKSDIAKEAMLFYIENKDRVITPGVIKILQEIGMATIASPKTESMQKPNIQEKLTKLNK